MSEFIRRSLEAYGLSGDARGGAMKQQILAGFASLCDELNAVIVRLGALGGEFGRGSIVRHQLLLDAEPYVPEPEREEFNRGGKTLSLADYANLKEVGALEIKISKQFDVAQGLMNAVAELGGVERGSRTEAARARLVQHLPNDPMVRERVWAITGGRCFYCECELQKSGPVEMGPGPGGRNNAFHIDHIVAKSDGGPDHLSNYVPACHDCNVSKSTKSFAEFTRKREPVLQLVVGGDQ